MRRLLRARSAAATVLGVIALVVAASAALGASRGDRSIAACVHKTGGGLYKAKHCTKHDSILRWSVAGPRGADGLQGAAGAKGDRGVQGPQGSQGEPGSARGFAFVEADGNVKHKGGSIDIAIDKIKTGEYCMTMNPRPDFFAPIVATIQGSDLTAGLINVNSSFGSDCDSGFGVFTMDKAGAATDNSFVVAVMGDPTGGSNSGAE
jgi:hypothetical protein